MTRTSRPLVAVALAGLVGLAGAGCGSDASSKEGAAGATTTTVAQGAEKQLSKQAKAVKFAECMRANGVPNFPDPDPEGEYDFGVDVTPQVFTRAVDACKALKPPGALSAKRTPKEQTASLKFARCMREHGVKDFPDPVNGEPLINTYEIPSSNKPGGMTILDAALATCGAVLEKEAGGQG